MTFDLERPWQVHAQVALRPEPFGALAYHFGTRRLSFLKTKKLLAVVEELGGRASGREACDVAGVSAAELPAYEQALASLAASGMVVPR
jgi:mycofactocin biosynthesis protein MftB